MTSETTNEPTDSDVSTEGPTNASSGSRIVEIERKFIVSDDTGEKIISAGGLCSEDVTLSDSYFDDENYSLTKQDCWLRRRNEKWELKMPPIARKEDSTCTQYQEVTSPEDIVATLSAILPPSLASGSASCNANGQTDQKAVADMHTVEQFVQSKELKPFAEFTSHRKSYKFSDSVTVTLDETDFGFQIGEIEVVVQENNADTINEAISKIDDLARELGMQDLNSFPMDKLLGTDILAILANIN